MYKFTDTRAMTAPRRPSIMMRYNNFLIEKEIKEYRTLTVSGRELLDEEIALIDAIPGRDGAIVSAQSTKMRELTIKYLIDAKDNRSYTLAFDRLNALLRSQGKQDAKIEFTDEPGVFYYGRYADAQRIEASSNGVVNEMRIICPDPHKYGEIYEYEGDPLRIPHLSPYGLKPEWIQFFVTANAAKLIVKNVTTGTRIILNGNYVVGDVIEIEIPKNEIRKNGQNTMAELDFTTSDFHTFIVHAEDEISVTPQAALKMRLRKRWL